MKLLSVVLLVLVLALPAQAGEIIRGMVKTVYDGDTVLLMAKPRGQIKVRLYGIDAPETAKPERPAQAYGAVARRVLMYKLLGKAVTLEVQEQDQYGRVVGVIRLDGRDINAEMVAEGLAWAYRQYLQGSYASEYLWLEEQARRRHSGLWRQPNPQPPWEFRRGSQGRRRR
ncbi:MAG: thermonuclease family protein [Trichlorobacter sp.]|jgi:endonuclease YncB( thermonuclease family)